MTVTKRGREVEGTVNRKCIDAATDSSVEVFHVPRYCDIIDLEIIHKLMLFGRGNIFFVIYFSTLLSLLQCSVALVAHMN